MLTQLNSPKAHTDEVVQLDKIGPKGRAQLLDMAFSRLRFGLFAMPFVSGIFVWYCHQKGSSYPVSIWSLWYFGFALVTFFINKAYLKDQATESAEYMLSVWQSRIHKMAILHGIGLMVLLPMVSHSATLEFKYLYILTLAAIMAGNATHQAPMLSVFNRFLIFGWHCTVLLMPWSFHDHWHFIMPLSAIYSVGMYRHALKSHRFFVRMVWLEEESARLAASYKTAKESAESAKESAENALKAKNQFITTASHDLRQPVHAMGFLIESISHRNQDSSLLPALKDLKQSVRSVTQMFNALLDLSKFESGKVEVHIGNIYLDNLIQEVATVFSEEARAKNIEIRTWVSKGNTIALADGTLLRQSIMNLMHNALRYTKTGGVLIAVRKRGDDWLIEVWDTGIGVAIDEQDRIYSPFYRNEHAWRIDSGGHGLGLSVVARCCELMDCQYGFSSRLGRGSHFWLRLPAIEGRLQSIRIINELKYDKLAVSHSELSGTCLIVDDDPQVINAWESLLSSWGVTLKCVNSAEQALAVLDSGFVPQAILCDQRLRAGESGFDILRMLLKRCPAAHGAMISGEFNSPELLKAEDEGYLVLHKPLEPELLLTLFSRWFVKSD